MRENMVGTSWVWVTRCVSTSAGNCSASKRSMTTTVPPRRIVQPDAGLAARRGRAARATGRHGLRGTARNSRRAAIRRQRLRRAAGRAAAAARPSAGRSCPRNRASPRPATRRRWASRESRAVASARLRTRSPSPGPSTMRQSSTCGHSAQRRERDVALRLRRDQHLRLAVVDDIGELRRGQKRIDAGVVEPDRSPARAALDEARDGSP